MSMNYNDQDEMDRITQMANLERVSRTSSMDRLPPVQNEDPDKPKWWSMYQYRREQYDANSKAVPAFLKTTYSNLPTAQFKSNGRPRVRREEYARIQDDNQE